MIPVDIFPLYFFNISYNIAVHLQHGLLYGMLGFPVKTLYVILLGKETWKGCFAVIIWVPPTKHIYTTVV